MASRLAVINIFPIHHIDPENVHEAFGKWHRVLKPCEQLLLASWEGIGTIDYGDESDIVALRYRSDELSSWVRAVLGWEREKTAI